ncbi:MAG: type II toxin-antitoxin system RelE/ParE family toxin [Deltaproteobacteria bacterium]|nr:type II toxin-antitoxin system RelE/ParE family toxin [Deltaproteobacteria bacterium]MBW1978964.1 type II toxin-antitoxin system RelE/ParE family toxin [Deltaproteobacteria bacterium]MBW2044468.1 type II toxin-antitoxin system RelE/ParE family toxin [Deltaproteobacteria bacterium]
MKYEIEFGPKAKKTITKLPEDIALRIIKKVEEVKNNPFRYLEHYEGDFYKLRIGDYRALIDVGFEKKILVIKVIDKRGRIYKR